MQDLVGRIAALDAGATETLKVISYFDALLASGVGVEAMLRAAAALSGATVGAVIGDRGYRFAATGERLEAATAADTSGARDHQSRALTRGVAWVEREAPDHANDAMVLERLAMALDIVEDRRAQPSRLAVVPWDVVNTRDR